MGRMEQESGKRSRRSKIRRAVLESVAAAGMLGVAFLLPNALQAMAKLGLLPKKRHKESIKRSRQKLLQEGLLEYSNGFLRLTEKGERKLRLWELQDFKIVPPKRKWDGKWRVLIFDIPEKRKGTREKVRHTLLSIGFERLQDSVWVYPYDCEDLILLLKADFKVGKDMLYLIVDSMEGDAAIRKLFGLPKDE